MIIAVDAAGGDYAPHEIVKGAMKASQEYGVDIALVGRSNILHTMTGRYSRKHNISIVNATEVINCDETPVKAVRSKPDSSIVVGINLIKEGEAAAFVSAGSTGAVYCAALLTLGKLNGIERPAICSILDITSKTPVLLVDAGANVDCRPSQLVEFANLGSIYAKHVLGIDSPRVGLLSNGTEETKGNHLTLETFPLLKDTDLNFIGNIEGHDILKGTADVVVTDGFTGNVVLKALEGMGDTFQSRLSEVGQAVSNSHHVQGRLLLSMVGLYSWARRMDYRKFGGACLLGVDGNIIIAHGRSQATAIKNAIGLAKQTAEGDILRIIKENHHEQTDCPG